MPQDAPRFACLLVENLPSKVETLLHTEDLAQCPVVIVRGWDERVLDASPIATAFGIGVGDTRRRVEQLCPTTVILAAREE